jgi:hypothetical protein
LVRGAATTILILHISAGGIAILSGAAALLFRKGSRRHRLAGNVFFVSMLTLSAIGACVAAFLPDRGSAVAGAFAFYLVATAWVTVRRLEGRIGVFEWGALLCALGIAVAAASLGWQGANSPKGLIDPKGQTYETAYFFAALAALGAAGDLKVILRRGLCGAQRIARHLWRMCFALFIAAGSFFLGQQQVFPTSVRGSPFLFVPVVAVLAVMIFWLARVRFASAYNKSARISSITSGRTLTALREQASASTELHP